MTSVSGFAAAKINLYLHLTGRRADGYHLVDSVVAFADIGDRLTARPASTLSLEVTGPEAKALAGESSNLVLRAARVLAEHAGVAAGAALHLEKNLPVSAGIGGGSADAAAALRLLRRLWRLAIDDAGLARLGERLGADVPVCVLGKAARVSGIGERIEPTRSLPCAGVLLANPRRPLPTAAVFNAYRGGFGEAVRRPEPMPSDAKGLAAMLQPTRNDLTAAAIGLVPEIGRVVETLGQLPDALISRMSGSGASCFALFPDYTAAARAQIEVAAAEPGWWCAAGSLLAAIGTC